MPRMLSRLLAAAALVAVGWLAPSSGNAVAPPSALTSTPLTLINGWKGGPFKTNQPAVSNLGNIVLFKGAMATTGTNLAPFVLPAADHPTNVAYVAANLCNAGRGYIIVHTDGTVNVNYKDSIAEAQCMTSLDGVSYAVDGTGFTTATLVNGWVRSSLNTAAPAFKKSGGIVYLRGGIEGGNYDAFTLPVGYRPKFDTYVSTVLCGGTMGYLYISPDGTVTPRSVNTMNQEKCFTSLDGVQFALSAAAFQPLVVKNGWVAYPSTAKPAVRELNGIVNLRGAIKTTSSLNPLVFVLPPGYRPAAEIYVNVSLCNGFKGQLHIRPNGVVAVMARDNFADAQCFTGLDGVSFQQ